MNEIATNDFDYSLVGTETAHKLKALSNQLDGIYQNYSVAVGEVLFKAQQELSNYGTGTFGQWVESNKISKSNAYNYINAYKFVQQLDEPKEKEIFSKQPQRLKRRIKSSLTLSCWLKKLTRKSISMTVKLLKSRALFFEKLECLLISTLKNRKHIQVITCSHPRKVSLSA